MRKAKSEGDEATGAKLGRRTIEDHWLSGNRDALVNILSSWWPDIGWQLTTAKTREALRQTLEPVKDHPDRQVLDRLLRPTNATAEAREIREKRLQLGRAVTCMHDARTQRDQCINACREIEWAMSQARPEQIEFAQREFSKRRAACQEAQTQSRAANAAEKLRENELFDQEAAFAQDELLTFIKKGKYALHPLNLANAMAGLPFAVDVPFLGVWQSHARCSGLECAGWPSFRYQVFEQIESMWERSKSSSLSPIEFFRQQIKVLPKTVWQTHPTIGSQKVDNYVRTYLSENWWYLQRAIEKSLQSNDDPRPMHFIIASNFNKFVREPKTHADIAMAKAEIISD
jgi:hypothetical protein